MVRIQIFQFKIQWRINLHFSGGWPSSRFFLFTPLFFFAIRLCDLPHCIGKKRPLQFQRDRAEVFPVFRVQAFHESRKVKDVSFGTATKALPYPSAQIRRKTWRVFFPLVVREWAVSVMLTVGR